jgi:hypothetical protein
MAKPHKHNHAKASTIAQSELQELVKLVEPCRRHTDLRRSIIDRLHAGARVEPGELIASIERGPQQQPSWGAVTAFFGPELAKRLREFIDFKPVRHLRIYDLDGEVRGWGAPRANQAPPTVDSVLELSPRRNRKRFKSRNR